MGSPFVFMKIMFAIISFFAFVTLSHAAGLIWAKRHQKASFQIRERGWKIHSYWLNGTLWSLLFASFFLPLIFSPRSPYPTWLSLAGAILFLIGFGMALKARFVLGYAKAMGERFFFPERDQKITWGLYRFLNNPMYDGFLLIFTGAAFAFGIKEYFYLAIASFLFMNGFLASIENYEWKWNRF